MSAANSVLRTPKLDEDEFDLIDEIRRCILWQPESDFTRACSCDQCLLKIARLMDFEKEIQAKKRLAQNYLSQLNRNEELCLTICSCAEWSRNMLHLLQNKLKAVYEELGVPWEHEEYDKFEVTDEEVKQKLRDCGLLGKPEEKGDVIVTYSAAIPESPTVLDYADTGDFNYSQTKAKNDACNIIKDIEKLEKEHDKDKQTAEAQKNSIDPAVSKMYIEKQIELVKDLPVKDLLTEVEALINYIHPIHDKYEKFDESRYYIYNTCAVIIKKKKEYWKGAPSLAIEGGHHNSNKLDEILESLLDEVKSFEAIWEEKYARAFTPYDRSNPKRQATR
ncbi:hypothetical protein CASFOL_003327 [Castilleja foliolosa]|uniref:Uncharacterized protein n=1 Tax=Castilleja foliolosa TaxID=1961234 RepID=A0ABD3EH88_9LAMI